MKLALGTVQFGLDYGISNQAGQVAVDDMIAILNAAKKFGITTLDSATAYGNSEQRIGNTDASQRFNIITKVPKLDSNTNSIIPFVTASLSALKRDSLSGLLFHHADDLISHGNAPTFIHELITLQQQGMVEDIGASLYTLEQWQALKHYSSLSLFQIPVNVLDQRFITPSILAECQQRGIHLHCRSLFLQGLLLMTEAQWPDYFSPFKAKLQTFQQLANQLNCSLLTLALAIVVHNSLNKQYDEVINKIVVGCCSVKQLEEIVEAYYQAQTLAINIDDLSSLASNELGLINPSLWR